MSTAYIGLPWANHKSSIAGKQAQYVPRNGAAAKTAANTKIQSINFYIGT